MCVKKSVDLLRNSYNQFSWNLLDVIGRTEALAIQILATIRKTLICARFDRHIVRKKTKVRTEKIKQSIAHDREKKH